MTPVFQTRFGAPHGNCFAAAVVSIVGGDILGFPDLSDLVYDGSEANAERHKRVASYLLERGFSIVSLKNTGYLPWGYTVGVGVGCESKLPHACVYLDGKEVHDPSPDGRGLREGDVWYLIYLRER